MDKMHNKARDIDHPTNVISVSL